MTSTQHTGRTCSEAEAFMQTQHVKTIMAEDQIDFAQAMDKYIAGDRRTWAALKDD